MGYLAFISYAHADEVIATRLHRALESYRVPKALRQKRAQLRPIFRDSDELSAHHDLSEKIREAVQSSQFLIVLCSPAAKASHWVSEEIRLFRQLHGEASILCVLLDGTPETSFPPALTEGGREPLAAALPADRAGFKMGVTRLAAALLNAPLDDLVQRQAKARARRLQWISVGAVSLSAIMAAMTVTAMQARNEARQAQARAENLVEYMVDDLKAQLEPVGRLEILGGLGDEIITYYKQQDVEKLSDESLLRQSKARHVLASVALDMGDYDKAKQEAEAVAALTAEVLRRNPDDPDAIFAHAQSEYYLGAFYRRINDYEQALIYYQNYADFGERLYEIDPNNIDYIMEAGWGQNNLGYVYRLTGNFDTAQNQNLKAIDYFEEAAKLDPDNVTVLRELSNVYAGVSLTYLKLGKYNDARTFALTSIEAAKSVFQRPNSSPDDKLHYIISLADYELMRDQPHAPECRKDQWEFILTELGVLLKKDMENLEWKSNYLGYGIDFLDICGAELSEGVAQSYLTVFKPLAQSYVNKTYIQSLSKIIQKHGWD